MYGMSALLLQTTLEQHGSLSKLAYNKILGLCLLSKEYSMSPCSLSFPCS